MGRLSDAQYLAKRSSSFLNKRYYTDEEWLFVCIVLLGRYQFNEAECILRWTVWPKRVATHYGASAAGFIEWLDSPQLHGTIPGWAITENGGATRLSNYIWHETNLEQQERHHDSGASEPLHEVDDCPHVSSLDEALPTEAGTNTAPEVLQRDMSARFHQLDLFGEPVPR